MFQLRAYLHVLVAVGLVGAFFFGAHWLSLPENLSKSTAQLSRVEARYVHSRWPQVRSVHDDGTYEQVSCGRVRALCESTKVSPVGQLNVWLYPGAFGEEPWVVAAESSQLTFLSEHDQRGAFAEFSKKPVFIACGFLLLSLIALAVTFWRRQREA